MGLWTAQTDPADWKRPPDLEFRALLTVVLKPFYLLTRPVFSGWENIPYEPPLLFVGNHTIYGIVDTPFLWSELFLQRGILLRGLGDDLHFRVPLWSHLCDRYGVVRACPENFATLMEQRQYAKLKGEQYALKWEGRKGFARQALEHGCTIVPFASIGAEDAFPVRWDGDAQRSTPLGRLYDALGVRPDVVFPIPERIRVERLYYRFCPPIRLDAHPGGADEAKVDALWAQTRDAVLHGIDTLKATRERDPDRRWRLPLGRRGTPPAP